MAHRSYSPYPSVDSASDYSPEPTAVSAPPKRRARGSMTAEERREARAHRNRLAAQASRDRKKVQHDQLCLRVSQLEEENRALRLGISGSSASNALDAALAKENAELRARVQQLELAWQNMTKILGSMAIPVPQADRSAVKSPVLNFPLSPAPTSVSSLSASDVPIEPTSSESTRELARFATVSIETALQRVPPSKHSLILRFLSEQNTLEQPRCIMSIKSPPLPLSTTIMTNVLCC